MNIFRCTLLFYFFFVLKILLSCNIKKEDLQNQKWFSFEDSSEYNGIKENLMDKLLQSTQGNLLLQALFYQKKCLQSKNMNFLITIKIGEAIEGSNTSFIYEQQKLTIIITLAVCQGSKTIQPLKRPILIKQNNFYRLYQLEVPDFIILAHELLHVLNHAELFSSNETELIEVYKKTFLDEEENIIYRRNAIQQFLCKKLNLPIKHFTLCNPYKDFWWNPYEGKDDLGDSLDEMTTILCSLHHINDSNRVRIGETLFLREYYKMNNAYKNLISWSHKNTAEKFVFKDKDLFNNTYVNTVLEIFSLMPKTIQNTVDGKMPLQLANSQQLQEISTLGKGYIYVQNKKSNYKEEISLLIYTKDENYDFVDELFTLPK